jgi:hypothetical protein
MKKSVCDLSGAEKASDKSIPAHHRGGEVRAIPSVPSISTHVAVSMWSDDLTPVRETIAGLRKPRFP